MKSGIEKRSSSIYKSFILLCTQNRREECFILTSLGTEKIWSFFKETNYCIKQSCYLLMHLLMHVILNFFFSSAPTSSRKRKYQSLSRPAKLFQYDKVNYSLKPLTVGKQQDLILRFLCPISEYQEVKFFSFFFS